MSKKASRKPRKPRPRKPKPRAARAAAKPASAALTPDDARRLSDLFEALADALREWRRKRAASLSNDEIRHLRNLQLTILHHADALTTVAVGLELDEAAVTLDQLEAATNKAIAAIETIKATKRAVEIAAATIALAAAVLAKDVGGAAKAAAALYKIASGD